MKKTTAKVEHRDYVPYGVLAIEYCKVDFSGFRSKEMQRKWEDIEGKRYHKYNSIYEENKTKIEEMRNEANDILKKLRTSRFFFRFYHKAEEKQKIFEANEILKKADRLEEKNKEIGAKRFFGVFECHIEIEAFLRKNGFILTNVDSYTKVCTTKIEIWTLEE